MADAVTDFIRAYLLDRRAGGEGPVAIGRDLGVSHAWVSNLTNPAKAHHTAEKKIRDAVASKLFQGEPAALEIAAAGGYQAWKARGGEAAPLPERAPAGPYNPRWPWADRVAARLIARGHSPEIVHSIAGTLVFKEGEHGTSELDFFLAAETLVREAEAEAAGKPPRRKVGRNDGI